MRRFLKGVVDLIFPPLCIVCGELTSLETGIFCEVCFSDIRMIRSPLCPRCGLPYPTCEGNDHLCEDCLKSVYSFTSARSTGQFETLLRDLIHRFKYQGQVAVGEKLGRFMAESDYVDFRIADYSLMIPIPLHRKRLQDRGFNQSVILSREISRYHGIPMRFDVLKRTIYTEPQVSLGRDDRNRNVQGAFEVTERGAIEGERILLIDDVYTTGSTVNECAGVLRQSGAEDVSVLTLARGL